MSDQELTYEEPAPEETEADQETETKTDEDEAPKYRAGFQMPDAQPGGAPDWVKIPGGFRFPRGKALIFLRFRADWTDTPWKGEPIMNPETGEPYSEVIMRDGHPEKRAILWRQCICWPISVGDKNLAINRSMSSFAKMQDELTRQFIRVVDGHEVSWDKAGELDVFWSELGERCRGLLHRMYTKLHVLDPESTQDFLQNCVAVRTSGA